MAAVPGPGLALGALRGGSGPRVDPPWGRERSLCSRLQETPGRAPSPCSSPPSRGRTGREPELSTDRPPRTRVQHPAGHPPGFRARGAGQAGLAQRGSNALPRGKFLPLGASLSHGSRPGPRACGVTQPTAAPGPATLTTQSHRRRSPPGTGSGNARAPPRLSCSAPVGRTWASPETFSSGGRGARRWPCGAPACTRSRSPALVARPGLAGTPHRPPAQGWFRPRRLLRAAPVSCSGWTRLSDQSEPG